MSQEYVQVNGKLVMTSDGKLVQVPDGDNLNDLADVNTARATQSEEVAKAIEDLIVNGVIDGSPRGVYASLSALQTEYPSGANGIFVCTDNGHWYYYDGSAWADGGIYQSAGVKGIQSNLLSNLYRHDYVIEDLASGDNYFISFYSDVNTSIKLYNAFSYALSRIVCYNYQDRTDTRNILKFIGTDGMLYYDNSNDTTPVTGGYSVVYYYIDGEPTTY